MINYLSYFPAEYKPNTQQVFVLNEIAKAKAKNLKYVVINAPTGSGKSFISKTLSNSIPEPSKNFVDFVDSGAIYDIEEEHVSSAEQEGTAVLTMTKALQDQYNNLFSDGVTLKGKSNYPCSMVPSLSCDLGPCTFDSSQKDLCVSCKQCQYYNQKDEAVSSKCSFYSYSMFLALSPACRAKKILICDEDRKSVV